MKRNKVDLIIEAVHHKRNGQIDFVRGYQKRGATYSDCFLVKRQELVDMITKGMKVSIGQRVILMGSTFSELTPVRVVIINDKATLMTSRSIAERKELTEVPIL